ncbi:MAG: PEGA domain-containing protein [Polyangiaceae bacterium]
MLDTQSSPSNPKADELFPELLTKKPAAAAPKSVPAPPSLRSQAPTSLVGKPAPRIPAPPSQRIPAPPSQRIPAPPSSRAASAPSLPPVAPSAKSIAPLPPSMRKPVVEATTVVEEHELVDEDEVETVDAREIGEESETVPLAVADNTTQDVLEAAAGASDLDSLGASLPQRAILPKYDAELDDGPTVALPSSVVNPPPTSRPSVGASRPAPLKSAPLPPLPSVPSSSAPSTPMSSAPSTPLPLSALGAKRAPAPPASARVPSALLKAGASAPPSLSLPPAALAAPSVDSSRLSSIPPVAESLLPPAAPKKRSVLPWLFAAAAVLAVGAAGATGLVMYKGSALGFGTAGNGTLVVTAAGTGGKAIQGLSVMVDGEKKCSASPCRIDGVKAGTRLVSATAPGYEATAARALSVTAGEESALHVELNAETVSAPAKVANEEAKPSEETSEAKVETKNAAPKSDEPSRTTDKSSVKPASAKAEPKTAAATAEKADKADKADKAAAMGTLNINSIPRANVVLDGRPMGMTPVMGVSVSPGNHTVVFVHPEQGRKVAGASVEAGKTATVGVRF